MGEYLKVDGHRDLVRDTRTGAILNKNKTAYLSYRKRVQEAQKQRDEIAISKRNIESEKMRQENFDDNFLNQLNLQIDDLTLKHKLSRKKLSDAAGESGEFSKQSIKLNAELDSIKNQINPSVYFSGMLNPYESAAKFSIYKDTVEVRKFWDTEGINIEF